MLLQMLHLPSPGAASLRYGVLDPLCSPSAADLCGHPCDAAPAGVLPLLSAPQHQEPGAAGAPPRQRDQRPDDRWAPGFDRRVPGSNAAGEHLQLPMQCVATIAYHWPSVSPAGLRMSHPAGSRAHQRADCFQRQCRLRLAARVAYLSKSSRANLPAGCILIVVSVVILLFAFGVTITVFRKIFAKVSMSAW